MKEIIKEKFFKKKLKWKNGFLLQKYKKDIAYCKYCLVFNMFFNISTSLNDINTVSNQGTNIQRLTHQQESGRICRQYGWMEDSAYDRPTPICGGIDRRTSDAYVSRGSTLKVWAIAADNPADVKRFVIKYTSNYA